MKTYQIDMPVSGQITKTIEANNKEEALEKFYKEIADNNYEDFTWETMPYITQGNVFYGLLNNMNIEEVD